MARNITRIGTTTGRWPRYRLIVDGVDLGQIRRTMDSGGDRLSPHARYDGWRIHGEICASRESAERTLIARAINFGILQEN